MKKLLFALLTLGAISAFGQRAFDGTWRLNTQSAEIKGNDKYSLQQGMYRCDTCVPKIAVKADGKVLDRQSKLLDWERTHQGWWFDAKDQRLWIRLPSAQDIRVTLGE